MYCKHIFLKYNKLQVCKMLLMYVCKGKISQTSLQINFLSIEMLLMRRYNKKIIIYQNEHWYLVKTHFKNCFV